MHYSDDDMLMLSGIQHFRFCPRQWAMIHMEQQWADNRLTAEGTQQHQHVDDAFYRQKCGDHIALRSVSLASHELGLYGISDVIELHPTDDEANSISHPSYPGRWLPYPVEYKHGRRTFLTAWQQRKRETIVHPFLNEKIPVGLIPHAQAMLLARYIRQDIDDYPVFLIK